MPLLALSNVIELLSRLMLMALVVNRYGIEQYGEYSYAMVGSQFLVISTMFGLGPAMVRFSELDHVPYEVAKLALAIVFVVSLLICYQLIGLVWFSLYYFYFSLNFNTYYLTSINKQSIIAPIRIISYVYITIVFISMDEMYMSMIYGYLVASIFLTVFLAFRLKLTISHASYHKIRREAVLYVSNSYLSQVSVGGLKFIEREVFSRFVDDVNFGLYSVLRDLANAVTYVFYLPLQIFWIKKIIFNIQNGQSLSSYVEKFSKYLMLLSILGFTTSYAISQFSSLIKTINNELLVSILSLNLYLLTIICVLDMLFKFFMVVKDAEGKPIISLFMNISLAVILLIQLAVFKMFVGTISISTLSYTLIVGLFFTMMTFVTFDLYKRK